MKSIILTIFILVTSAQAFAGFASIAYNPNTQQWGEAHGYLDANAAVHEALFACGFGCQSLAWSENSCLALANNPSGGYGYSWGFPNAQSAINAAVTSCNSQGTGPCLWQVWTCN